MEFTVVEDLGMAGACAGGHPANCVEIVKHQFKSWLHVTASPTADQCPVDQIKAAGLAYAHVPVESPVLLTRDNAATLVATIKSLPAPVFVQCASANRASAVVALYVGSTRGWDAAATMEWAHRHGLKFMGSPALRNWVSATLAPLSPAAEVAAGGAHPGLFFRQLFEPVSSTYTYLLADPASREAVLIDPVAEKAERDAALVREYGLTLKYAVNTHVHADHVSGTAKLKTLVPGVQSAIAAVSGARADVCLGDGSALRFGSRRLEVLSTPGHTDGCLSFVLDDKTAVFTGDAVLIRGCGRTDFQQGSPAKLWHSITTKIWTLPPACAIYPGHDYNGNLKSTVAEERALNARLAYGRTLEDFTAIMNGLNLPPPKQLDVAVPANMYDGHPVLPETGKPAADAVFPAPCEACRQDAR